MDTLIPVYDATGLETATVSEDYVAPNGMTMNGAIVPYSAKLVHYRKDVSWNAGNKTGQYLINLEKKIISVVSLSVESIHKIEDVDHTFVTVGSNLYTTPIKKTDEEYKAQDNLLLKYEILSNRRGIVVWFAQPQEGDIKKLIVCMTLLVEETIRNVAS